MSPQTTANTRETTAGSVVWLPRFASWRTYNGLEWPRIHSLGLVVIPGICLSWGILCRLQHHSDDPTVARRHPGIAWLSDGVQSLITRTSTKVSGISRAETRHNGYLDWEEYASRVQALVALPTSH